MPRPLGEGEEFIPIPTGARQLAEGEEVLPAGEMTPQEFTKARQSAATNEPAFGTLARATIPTALGVGGMFVPGMQGAAAQALLGGAGVAANQALGLEPQDTTEIGKGALFGMLGGLVRPGVKATGELFAPGPLKEAGVEAGVSRLGGVARSVDRAFTTPASKAAYAAAQQVGAVPTRDIVKVVDSLYAKLDNLAVAKPRAALRALDALRIKLNQSGIVDYGDMIDEVQGLKDLADSAVKHNKPTARALNTARTQIIDVMNNISPEFKEANRLYRRESATQEVIDALRSSNAANATRELFEQGNVAGAMSKSEYAELEKLAMQIAEVPSPAAVGGFRTLMMSFGQQVGNALMSRGGRAMLRSVMKPTGSLTPAGAAAVAQFMRAYSASGVED